MNEFAFVALAGCGAGDDDGFAVANAVANAEHDDLRSNGVVEKIDVVEIDVEIVIGPIIESEMYVVTGKLKVLRQNLANVGCNGPAVVDSINVADGDGVAHAAAAAADHNDDDDVVADAAAAHVESLDIRTHKGHRQTLLDRIELKRKLN